VVARNVVESDDADVWTGSRHWLPLWSSSLESAVGETAPQLPGSRVAAVTGRQSYLPPLTGRPASKSKFHRSTFCRRRRSRISRRSCCSSPRSGRPNRFRQHPAAITGDDEAERKYFSDGNVERCAVTSAINNSTTETGRRFVVNFRITSALGGGGGGGGRSACPLCVCVLIAA